MSTNTNTVIQTKITSGQNPVWVATTPHLPKLQADDQREHRAVNKLAALIRAHRAPFEAKGEPVPWDADPKVKKDSNTITRRLSGLWPATGVAQPKALPAPPEAPEAPAPEKSASVDPGELQGLPGAGVPGSGAGELPGAADPGGEAAQDAGSPNPEAAPPEASPEVPPRSRKSKKKKSKQTPAKE